MFSAGSRSSSSYTSSDSDSTDTKNTVNRKLSYVSVESIPDTLVEVHVYREAYNRPRPTPVAEKPFSPNPSAVLACATDDRQRLDRSELERKRQREEEARKAKENELPPLPPPSRPTSGTEKKVAEETSLPSISEEETEVKQPLDVVNNEGLQSIETVEPKQPLADCGVDEPLPHLEQTSEFTDQRRQSQVRTPHEHILSPPLSESSSSSASACSDKETQWNSSSGVRPVKKPYSDKKKVSKDKLEELDTIWKDRGEREKCIQVGPNAVSVAKHLPPPVFGVSKEARAAPSRVRKEAASKKEKVKPSIERGSENGDGSDGDFSSSYSYSSWSTYSRSPSVPDTEDEPRAKYTETGVDPICLDDELRVETMLESLEEEILINNSDTSKNNSVSKSGGESQGGGSQSTVPKKASEAKRRTKSRHRHHHHHHPQRQSSVHGRGTGAREGATKLPPISKAGRSSKNRERAEEEQAARRHHHSHHHVKERKDKPLHKAGTSASKTEPSRDRKAKPSSSQTVPKLKQSAMEEYDGSHYWTAHSPYMQRVFPHSESSAENTSGHGGTQEGGRTNRRDGNVNGKGKYETEDATSRLARVDDPYAFLLGRHGFWGENKYLFEQSK